MSVRLRVALAAAAVFGLVFAVMAAVGIALLERSLIAEIDRSNEIRALDIEAQTADEEEVPLVAAGFDPSTVAAIVDIDGNVLSATDDLAGDELVVLYRNQDGPFEVGFSDLDSVVGSDSMRATTVQVVESDEFVETFVFVAASTAAVDRTVREARTAALVAGPLLVALVGALVYVMAGRALRPVERIRREVEEITAGQLDRRIPDPGTGDEIEALASTMNDMLERLHAAAERQRRFTADASHELRSPLASIAAQLDVDLAHPRRADWESTARSVRADTTRLQQMIDDLLVLARSDGTSPDSPHADQWAQAMRSVPLDDIVLEAVARMPPDPRVETVRVDRVDVRGDARLLDRVVVNLTENARRHGRDRIVVSTWLDGGEGVLVVEDDGPGIAPDDRARIFERFVRLDDARSRDAGGAGLGLALCAEIVRLHRGSITVDDSELGGARFTVRIPSGR